MFCLMHEFVTLCEFFLFEEKKAGEFCGNLVIDDLL